MTIFDLGDISNYDQFGFFSKVFSFVSTVWTTYAVFAYLISIILLSLYIYAAIKFKDLKDLEDEMIKKSEESYKRINSVNTGDTRWQEIETHINSINPNDWKLAIIEADILLDDILKKTGYAGNTLGERMKSISPSVLASIDDAWEAHRVRNSIAHAGSDFILTQNLAKETIVRYRRVFEELGAL